MSSFHQRRTGAEPPRGFTAAWVRGLICTVLAGLLPAAVWAAPLNSRPYLTRVGSPMLRFAAPPLERTVPELPEALRVTGQPEVPVEAEVTPTPDESVEAPEQPVVQPTRPIIATPDPVAVETQSVDSPPPVSLLPDDLAPRTTPEDFLPYFLPPQPPSAPRSQATYQLR